MENIQKVYQGVNPFEYEELKHYLVAEEHVNVVETGIDSFEIVVTKVVGNFNRNGQILNITVVQTEWSDDSVEDLSAKLTSMVDKEEVTGQVQPTPLQTPMDRKTGLPLVPEPEPEPPESDPGDEPPPEEGAPNEAPPPPEEEPVPVAAGGQAAEVPIVIPKKKSEEGSPEVQ